MYRGVYRGTLYHGTLGPENTVVHLYRGTCVPRYECTMLQMYKCIFVPWYIRTVVHLYHVQLHSTTLCCSIRFGKLDKSKIND